MRDNCIRENHRILNKLTSHFSRHPLSSHQYVSWNMFAKPVRIRHSIFYYVRAVMLVQLQQFKFDNYPGLQPRQTYSDQPFWGWFVRTAILCHRNTFSHWKLSAKRQSGVNSCAHAPTTCVCAKEGWKVHWRVCVMMFAVKRITDRRTNAEEMQLRQSNHRCRWVNVWVDVLQLQMLRIWLQAIFTNTTAQQSIVYTLPYHTIPQRRLPLCSPCAKDSKKPGCTDCCRRRLLLHSFIHSQLLFISHGVSG